MDSKGSALGSEGRRDLSPGSGGSRSLLGGGRKLTLNFLCLERRVELLIHELAYLPEKISK